MLSTTLPTVLFRSHERSVSPRTGSKATRSPLRSRIMNIETLKEIVARLNASASAVAFLGAALDARLTGKPLPPTLAPHVADVLEAIGAKSALENVSPADLAPVLAEIRG